MNSPENINYLNNAETMFVTAALFGAATNISVIWHFLNKSLECLICFHKVSKLFYHRD